MSAARQWLNEYALPRQWPQRCHTRPWSADARSRWVWGTDLVVVLHFVDERGRDVELFRLLLLHRLGFVCTPTAQIKQTWLLAPNAACSRRDGDGRAGRGGPTVGAEFAMLDTRIILPSLCSNTTSSTERTTTSSLSIRIFRGRIVCPRVIRAVPAVGRRAD